MQGCWQWRSLGNAMHTYSVELPRKTRGRKTAGKKKASPTEGVSRRGPTNPGSPGADLSASAGGVKERLHGMVGRGSLSRQRTAYVFRLNTYACGSAPAGLR